MKDRQVAACEQITAKPHGPRGVEAVGMLELAASLGRRLRPTAKTGECLVSHASARRSSNEENLQQEHRRVAHVGNRAAVVAAP